MSTNPWCPWWDPLKWNLNIWRFPGFPRVPHFPGPGMPVKSQVKAMKTRKFCALFGRSQTLRKKPFIGFRAFLLAEKKCGLLNSRPTHPDFVMSKRRLLYTFFSQCDDNSIDTKDGFVWSFSQGIPRIFSKPSFHMQPRCQKNGLTNFPWNTGCFKLGILWYILSIPMKNCVGFHPQQIPKQQLGALFLTD